MDNSILVIVWRITLAAMAIILIYTEFTRATNLSTDGDEVENYSPLIFIPAPLLFEGPITYLVLRYTWICLSALLLIEDIGFSPSSEAMVGPFPLSAILFLIGMLRLAYLKLTWFADAKADSYVSGETYLNLKGEIGVLVQDVTATGQSRVQLQNPLFKNDILNCIADNNIKAGATVKIVEVDCGLLKVARLNASTTSAL